MSTVFISDLHLEAGRPDITEAFARFLSGLPGSCAALYILGDLFDAWVGDDDDAPLPALIADRLKHLADSGTTVAFMAGNRDFALGADYARRAGFRLLDDPTVIDLHGRRALLMHGDTLCSDDAAYQAFRAQVRQPAWLAQMLAQPLAVRRAFAAQARAQSGAHTAMTAETIMDVNADAVANAFRQHDVELLIHGHTHRPARHELVVDAQPRTRIVLGDWYHQGTVLVAHDDGTLDLRTSA